MRCGDSCEVRDAASPLICGRSVAGGPGNQDLGLGEQQRTVAVGLALQAAGYRRAAAPRSAPRARACASAGWRDHRKAEQRQRRRQRRELLMVHVDEGGDGLQQRQVGRMSRPGQAKPGRANESSKGSPPPRASEVHDSKVRRIAAITPDMVYPKPHDLTPGEFPRRARIKRQYRQGDSRGKSPDRERESLPQENAGLNLRRSDFLKINAAGLAVPDQRPVEPNPPLPRAVAESVATGTSSAWTTDAITICAMRSPRRIVNGTSP